jgi:hypothetical protein
MRITDDDVRRIIKKHVNLFDELIEVARFYNRLFSSGVALRAWEERWKKLSFAEQLVREYNRARR